MHGKPRPCPISFGGPCFRQSPLEVEVEHHSTRTWRITSSRAGGRNPNQPVVAALLDELGVNAQEGFENLQVCP